MSAALAFDGVTGERGGRMLFADLSFALRPGDAALVTGPNGAGKSSLVRIAAGLLAPLAGCVTTEGGIALLTEAAALDGDLPLARAVGFWARIDGRSAAVGDALAALGLAAMAEMPMRLLSTGQRKRAALARVLASGAGIWLLDEPANGLDAASVGSLEAAIAAHRLAGGVVLVATHLPLSVNAAQQIQLGSAA